MFALDGKIALVTGASRGIGRAIAQVLAEQGARVVVAFASQEAAANEVVSALCAAGKQAEAVQLDVSDSARVDAVIADVVKRHGKLDLMVANAGMSVDALLLRLKDEDLDRMLAVNLRGAMACARAAIKTMMRARTGRVVFLTSVVGEMGNAGQSGYAATKAALIGVTRSLAREVGSRGITVNAVAPGFIDTDMTSSIQGDTRAAVEKQIPLGRIGTPADVAAAVAFLCSDEAAYVTGHVLRVNGGMYT
ncbi:MAG: 3-oxoacyl-[acyl-carrier-protein] reductase [Deltaproteobacteria bacterium]|nr:3-oxoacyl-[acyl-carrier-protein] reductase [Deltaproteobacteria bacterium]